MKIKDGFILRQVAGSYIVIGVDSEAVDFNGMINVNETGAFLWETLAEGCTKEELLDEFLKEYDVDEETAKADIAEFMTQLMQNGLINIDE